MAEPSKIVLVNDPISSFDEMERMIFVTILSKEKNIVYSIVIGLDRDALNKTEKMAEAQKIPFAQATMMAAWCIAGEELFGRVFVDNPNEFPLKEAYEVGRWELKQIMNEVNGKTKTDLDIH